MKTRVIFQVWLACVASGASYADAVFPDLPSRDLPHIEKLPKTPLILEVRSTVLSGDPVRRPGGRTQSFDSVGIEVGVFNLTDQSESIWDLPKEIVPHVKMTCNECTMRGAWLSKPRSLFLALEGGAYLIDDSGSYSKVAVTMPGVSLTYSDTNYFSVSDNGQLLAFRVYGRDPGNKSASIYDPYAEKYGRLYAGIFYEDLHGSTPREVDSDKVFFFSSGSVLSDFVSLPAWSPDNKKIAFQRRDDPKMRSTIEIIDINDAGIPVTESRKFIPIPGDSRALELRWSPNGKKLAFNAIERWFEQSKPRQKITLYVADANGVELKEIQFEGNPNIQVQAFAWSPSGNQFAFRSDYETKMLCNINLSFYIQAGKSPCRVANNLFISNSDGSNVKKISKEPEYRRGQLFWVQ